MVSLGASLRDARLFPAPTDRGLKPTATIGASLRDAGEAYRLAKSTPAGWLAWARRSATHAFSRRAPTEAHGYHRHIAPRCGGGPSVGEINTNIMREAHAPHRGAVNDGSRAALARGAVQHAGDAGVAERCLNIDRHPPIRR
jgi:hypothetical protein